ncbi:MAG: enoyl-CoA hydratase/isomerase family protein [Bdellovibrionales bacterium]|nr:enoyl-CoA hydratase/isomerase family protein [Bdellovibrionales bacterium]
MILCEERDRVFKISLNRPERKNALTLEMIDQLQLALDRANASTAAVVVLGGEGSLFCSGHDFADMVERDIEQMRVLMQHCSNAMMTVRRLQQPVIAVVQGAAIGAGCQLALSCDLVVAERSAVFRTPGAQSGWFCSTPSVAVSRALPAKRAFEMLFCGDPVTAEQALEWGMINRVAEPGELQRMTDDLIHALLRGSCTAKKIGKKLFYAQQSLDETAAYELAQEVMASSALLPEGQETMRAFLEKRPPKFD